MPKRIAGDAGLMADPQSHPYYPIRHYATSAWGRNVNWGLSAIADFPQCLAIIGFICGYNTAPVALHSDLFYNLT